MVVESFAGYSSLGWHLCSLRVCITSVQDLLTFIVSAVKSGVILIGLHLYVTCVFSLSYPLKGWIHGKILCEFGFVMEYFSFSIYGN